MCIEHIQHISSSFQIFHGYIRIVATIVDSTSGAEEAAVSSPEAHGYGHTSGLHPGPSACSTLGAPPVLWLQPLIQFPLNTAARLMLLKSDHLTFLLKPLQWIPI